MMRRTVRRHVTASPERVMDALIDWSQWPRWRPGLDDVRNVSDDPILHATAWNESRKLGGRTLSLLARAVEVDAPHSFAYTASGSGLDVIFRWTVRGDNERALVAQEAGVRAAGFRHMLSGAAKVFLAQQDGALDQFRLLFPKLKQNLAT